jgi:chromosome segregation and condensation protein ScpB
VAGGLRIVLRLSITYLRRFFEASSASRLSMAALETLAIVAIGGRSRAGDQDLRGKSAAALKCCSNGACCASRGARWS